MVIAVIGNGNVGGHLVKALETTGHEVTSVNPRTLENFPDNPELCIISVSDNAIPAVADNLSVLCEKKGINPVVAHTSGTTPIEVVGNRFRQAGVFYPLQTFSKNVTLHYGEIPFLIEGGNAEVEKMLVGLASQISDRVETTDSEKRRAVHISSVFACNFVNHLWSIADGLLEKNGIDFSLLLPLIGETFRKAQGHHPAAVQTGPAVRGDKSTLLAHLKLLEGDERLSEIYKLLSNSINELNKL